MRRSTDRVVRYLRVHRGIEFRWVGDIAWRADQRPFKIVRAVLARVQRLFAMPVVYIALTLTQDVAVGVSEWLVVFGALDAVEQGQLGRLDSLEQPFGIVCVGVGEVVTGVFMKD